MSTGILTRRQAILALLAMPLGQSDVLHARASRDATQPGVLRIRLDEWAGLEIEYQRRSIKFTSAELFTILGGRADHIRRD